MVGDGSYGRDNHPSNIKLRVIRVILVLPVKYSLEPGGILSLTDGGPFVLVCLILNVGLEFSIKSITWWC